VPSRWGERSRCFKAVELFRRRRGRAARRRSWCYGKNRCNSTGPFTASPFRSSCTARLGKRTGPKR
jgi:hypothetical protein